MTTRHALLGLIADGPATGYQLKQHVDRALRHFWSESYGQIYPALRALVDDGLATVAPAPANKGPERLVYQITRAGRAELRRWLAAPVRRAPVRNEVMLKIFLARHVGPGPCLALIEAYAEEQRVQLDALRPWEPVVRAEAEDDPDAAYRLMTLRLGIALAEARLAWCDESRSRLRDHNGPLESRAAPAAPPGGPATSEDRPKKQPPARRAG